MKIKILSALAAVLLLSGCGNKWLEDVTPQDGTISPEVMFSSTQGVDAAFTGAYDMIKRYSTDSRHVSYGFKDYQLAFDYMGNDLVADPGQWWTYEAQWFASISAYDGYQTSFVWNLFYKVINNVNSIIAGVTKADEKILSPAFKKAAIAEASAIRGWALFQLAHVYQKSYMQASLTDPCVPIYLEQTTTATVGQPRASVEKVYTQILTDLSEANIANVPASNGNYRANTNVVYAWRAQVLLEMGKWDEAAACAAKAAAGHPLMSATEFRSGFNAINAEWIWGAPIQEDQALGYASFFSFADMDAGSGYVTFFANVDFANMFSATDCRNLFIYPYYTENLAEYGAIAQDKFRSKPNSFFLGDYVYIRAAEMLLIEAECMARTGNAGAADKLYELQLARDSEAVKSGNSGEALVEEILIERRKELVGECGVGYFDARRLGRPMMRTGNSPFPSISATDSRWLFQYPKSEGDNNPNIGPQNPR